MKIENIIFDLGGVILDIDYNATLEAFANLRGENFDSVYSQYAQSDLFDRFEKGLISAADFRQEFRAMLQINCSDAELYHAWNAMLGSIPPNKIDLLKSLSSTYRIFLLSNTNEIHLDEFTKIIADKNGIMDFPALFEKAYFSHLVGMRKPDKEIFEYVINQNKLNPDFTMFLDDSAQHIEGAKKCGLHTRLVPSNSKINGIFAQRS